MGLRRGRGKVIALAALLPLLLTLPLGCGGGGKEAISEVVLTNLALRDSFALCYPVLATTSPRIPGYAVRPDLSNVAGMGQASLPPGASKALAEKGFVVTPGAVAQIYQVYQNTAGPKFVTVDALLHAFHVLCGYALRDMEQGVLQADLEGLVGALFHAVEGMFRGSRGRVREAACEDLAYLGVAARLLGVEAEVPPEVAGRVEEELGLILDHSDTATSPLFGYPEDYGQYAPRGHYAAAGDLGRYFQAMTWLGRMGFHADPGSRPSDIAAGRKMTRQALLLVAALHMGEVEGKPALAAWDRVYQSTAFLVGLSRDLDAYLYSRLMGEVFGRRFPLERLEDDAAVDDFVARVLAEQPSGVGSEHGSGGDKEAGAFRLFGRPCARDAYIFRALVADGVADRFMPRGLDVPAAFGSDRALAILDEVYGETVHAGYAENLQRLRGELANIDPAQARSSVYSSWLDALRVLLRPCGEGYPAFMGGVAWQDRDLYAYLGAWAELHHDTAFITGQGAEAGLGQPPTGGAVKGYVEPRPEAFARLASTADMLRRGVEERNLAGAAVRERLDALYELLVGLKTMAEKELRNEPLSGDEYQAIADIGATLQYLTTFPASGEDGQATETDPSLAQVAEVYADATFGEVLEAAVGRPAVYYVIAPVEGKPTLTVGAGFTYYELVRPTGGRLTDQAWQEMLDTAQAPAPPAWTDSFLR